MTPDRSTEGRDDGEVDSPPRQYRGPRTFDTPEEGYGIYECRECDNVVLTVHPAGGEMSCHGRDMREITEWEIEVQSPELRQVLLDAFGLPKLGLDICLCVIGEGPLSPGDVADILDYDQSTVSRYLNQLVDIGLLEKAQLNREGGGFVNVYHSIDLDEMRRETLIGFYVWAGEAASLIEKANLTKEQYVSGDHSEGIQEVFWEEFRGNP